MKKNQMRRGKFKQKIENYEICTWKWHNAAEINLKMGLWSMRLDEYGSHCFGLQLHVPVKTPACICMDFER